jgi:hypothetical protein
VVSERLKIHPLSHNRNVQDSELFEPFRPSFKSRPCPLPRKREIAWWQMGRLSISLLQHLASWKKVHGVRTAWSSLIRHVTSTPLTPDGAILRQFDINREQEIREICLIFRAEISSFKHETFVILRMLASTITIFNYSEAMLLSSMMPYGGSKVWYGHSSCGTAWTSEAKDCALKWQHQNLWKHGFCAKCFSLI